MNEFIYRQYHDKVLRYLTGKTNNPDLAEDLCSDVFLKVYEKLDSFDETKASVSTWIFTITRNTLTDYYRTRKVNSEIPVTAASSSLVEDDYCNQETLDTLTQALQKLSEKERDLVILKYYSGKTLKEISEQMGISYSYAKILHNKALDQLKNLI